MTIKLNCKTCDKYYELNDALAGKKGRCDKCGEVFLIEKQVEEIKTAPIEDKAPELSLKEELKAELKEELKEELKDEIEEELKEEIEEELKEELEDEIKEEIEDELREEIKEEIQEELKDNICKKPTIQEEWKQKDEKKITPEKPHHKKRFWKIWFPKKEK